jgi:hypothetical protein
MALCQDVSDSDRANATATLSPTDAWNRRTDRSSPTRGAAWGVEYPDSRSDPSVRSAYVVTRLPADPRALVAIFVGSSRRDQDDGAKDVRTVPGHSSASPRTNARAARASCKPGRWRLMWTKPAGSLRGNGNVCPPSGCAHRLDLGRLPRARRRPVRPPAPRIRPARGERADVRGRGEVTRHRPS